MSLLDLFNMKYPSTDFHELNLDWCISAVLQLQKAFEDFSAGNKLTFADPLQHDLTKTYAKNTIVVDPVSGTAYLSLQEVAKGVQLDNTEYWLPVFDFAGYVTRANQNFTDNYFSGTDRTPHALLVDDWVVLDDVLYKVTVAMDADDLFIIGTNIVHFTVEQFLKDFITSVNQTLYNYSLTIQQYKNDIDASELAYRQQLAQDIADTTATLQAQLNAAISGVTVDSEVINARVTWDGITLSTLRDAIVLQVGEIRTAIDSAFDISNMSTIIPNSRVNYNSGIQVSDTVLFDVIEYDDIREGDIFAYLVAQEVGALYGLAFYDENNSYISGVTSYGITPVLVAAPSNAKKLKATIWHDKPYELLSVKPLPKMINNMHLVKSDYEMMEFNWVYGNAYIDYTGANNSLTDMMCTSFIDVSKIDEFLLSGTSSNDAPILAFYDSSYALVSTIPASASEVTLNDSVITPPSTAKYFRINCFYYYDNTKAYPRVLVSQCLKHNKWSDKKWIVFGDSWSLPAPNRLTWEMYAEFIKFNTGIQIYNMAGDGTGYMNYPGQRFYERVLNIPSDYDVITIFGSGNDMGKGYPLGDITDSGTATLCGAINTTIDNLFATDMNIKLGLITPAPWAAYPPTVADNEMELYANAIIAIAKSRSIPVLDLYHESGLRPWDNTFKAAYFDSIGVHPNEKGHQRFASMIYNFIESLIEY